MTQIQALYAVVAAGRGEDRERLRAVTADQREGATLLISARTLWPGATLVRFSRDRER